MPRCTLAAIAVAAVFGAAAVSATVGSWTPILALMVVTIGIVYAVTNR